MGAFDPQIADVGLIATLGIRFLEATPQRVVATMPVTPAHHQPAGYLHGGASVALAETIASLGGTLNCPPEAAANGLEINANHLRSAHEGLLTGEGRPLHVGRRTQGWEVRIRDERERLICVARCTLAVVTHRPDG